jgi:hypothetical protein
MFAALFLEYNLLLPEWAKRILGNYVTILHLHVSQHVYIAKSDVPHPCAKNNYRFLF